MCLWRREGEEREWCLMKMRVFWVLMLLYQISKVIQRFRCVQHIKNVQICQESVDRWTPSVDRSLSSGFSHVLAFDRSTYAFGRSTGCHLTTKSPNFKMLFTSRPDSELGHIWVQIEALEVYFPMEQTSSPNSSCSKIYGQKSEGISDFATSKLFQTS